MARIPGEAGYQEVHRAVTPVTQQRRRLCKPECVCQEPNDLGDTLGAGDGFGSSDERGEAGVCAEAVKQLLRWSNIHFQISGLAFFVMIVSSSDFKIELEYLQYRMLFRVGMGLGWS